MIRATRYPVYVPTKGRSETPLTIKFMERDHVPYFAVVVPAEDALYERVVGEHGTMLVLPDAVSNLMETRLWIRDHAEASGAARHWQFDDNIEQFRRLYQGRRIPCETAPAIRSVEDFSDRYENVGVSGFNYQMFCTPGSPPYVANVHVYSATLVNHLMPARWRLVYNDDTDLCLQALSTGWATLLVNVFMVNKMRTMMIKGGNTDALYQGDGRMQMARALEREWPGIAKVSRRFGREQHFVDWGKFKDRPALRRRSDVDFDALPANDEYGLRLRPVRKVASPQLASLVDHFAQHALSKDPAAAAPSSPPPADVEPEHPSPDADQPAGDGDSRRPNAPERLGLDVDTPKPPYLIPSLAEILATPSNGLRVVSTFSGAGGSCLGWRWAGYDVVWASEFVPLARETYQANFTATPVDDRDVREMTSEDVLRGLAALGMEIGVGDLDVLEGSPPCASYSTAGNREADWGSEKSYSGQQQRTDDLFEEYTRLLRGLQPRAFVAENVPGLAAGTAKGEFRRYFDMLADSGYRVEARVIDASRLGVPQKRSRLVFVGIRLDLERAPAWPAPRSYSYTIRDALPYLRGLGTKKGVVSADRPAPTVQTHGRPHTESELTAVEDDERRPLTIDELKQLCGFPIDYVLTGTYAQQWERLGRAVPPPMMRAVAETLAVTLKGEDER